MNEFLVETFDVSNDGVFGIDVWDSEMSFIIFSGHYFKSSSSLVFKDYDCGSTYSLTCSESDFYDVFSYYLKIKGC